MISNQILQNTIDGLKGITRIDLCVINTEGKVLAATFAETENYIEAAETFADSPADSQVMQGCQFFKVYSACKRRQRRCVYGGQNCGISDPESAGCV